MEETKIEKLEQRLQRKIKQAKARIKAINEKEAHVKNKSLELTYHAGWNLGYWQGKLAELENTMDELEEMGLISIQSQEQEGEEQS